MARKRASVCITHAGLNTVLESLAQGVPQVAIPVTVDQPGVAARIAEKKTELFVPLKKLTVSHQSRQRDVMCAASRSQPCQTGRSGRIRRHYKVARRSEGGKRHQRQQQSVEPRNDRRSRDLCVTHRLRNVHCRQRYARGQVGGEPRTVKRKDALK